MEKVVVKALLELLKAFLKLLEDTTVSGPKKTSHTLYEETVQISSTKVMIFAPSIFIFLCHNVKRKNEFSPIGSIT